jgi:hypothetical protein
VTTAQLTNHLGTPSNPTVKSKDHLCNPIGAREAIVASSVSPLGARATSCIRRRVQRVESDKLVGNRLSVIAWSQRPRASSTATEATRSWPAMGSPPTARARAWLLAPLMGLLSLFCSAWFGIRTSWFPTGPLIARAGAHV